MYIHIHIYIYILYVFLFAVMPRHKDKPGVADRIIARTSKFKCPLTDRIMYEDMSYKSKRLETNHQSMTLTKSAEQSKLQAMEDRPTKKAKKAIGDEENQAPAAEVDPSEKCFNATQKKQLTKFGANYAKMIEDVALRVDQVSTENLETYMPRHLLTKQTEFAAKLKLASAELEVTIEVGTGDYRQYKDSVTQTKVEMKDIMARCDAAITEACSAKIEDETPLGANN